LMQSNRKKLFVLFCRLPCNLESYLQTINAKCVCGFNQNQK